MVENFFDFIGGTSGEWEVIKTDAVAGDSLARVSHLKIIPSTPIKSNESVWTLKGFNSNIRYAEKQEVENLRAIQAELGRPKANCAALIPIRKSPAWWALAQDERRKIFETKSQHTATGLQYLPAIARKLYHCRDVGEPFDFLTWFEYAPAHADAFEELVTRLRKTEEWQYVEREIDIRLLKES